MNEETNLKSYVLMSIFLLAMGCTAAMGRTIYVDDDGPADFNTIQAAINDAIHSDIVIVADGVYTGVGNRDIDFKGKAITVRSEDGPENCIIDCQWLGSGFSFHSGEDNDSVLDGFSITQGGWAKNGIMCEDYSNPTITNCMITRTTHGIYVTNKNTSKITNCVTFNNSGSGICCFDSSPTITNCTIADNGWFGIKCFHDSFPTITNSILRGNSSPQIDDTGPSTGHATVTYSNVQGGRGGEGNIDADPCFASSSYYRLMPNSACIDAGTNIPVGGLPQTDIEGYPCPTDGDNDSVAVADMGAYESWPPSEPVIWLSKWEFVFIANEGGPNPAEQILTIHNSGAGTINWIISHNCQWLEVDPIAGSSSGQANDVVLSADVNGLPAGKYNGFLTVSGPNAINTPLVISVSLYVGTPSIGVASTEVYFFYHVGTPSPEPQTFSIWNDAAGRLDWQIIEDCNWLQVDPNTGSSTGEANEVTLSVDVSGLAPNIYNCQFTISAETTVNSPKIVQVFLHIYDNHGILHVPSQYGTIQAAIDFAINGDTVLVADGVYTGPGNRDIDFKGKAITVLSANGPEYCIIDCNGTASDQHRGFFLHSGEDANSAIIGFTITNGYAPFEYLPPFFEYFSEGGAILLENSSPTISNCIITGNSSNAQYNSGGGIFNSGGRPTITNCIFSRNWAGGGGGIYSEEGGPTITNCTFSGNQAQDRGGGGIYCRHGITVTNCILWGNRDSYGEDAISQFCVVTPTTVFINYYCIQGVPGALNPLFADANNDDYHLQSQAGRWDPNSQSWVQDEVTSPCIDAGDPNSAIGLEPFPNGGVINIGAYGGTAEASKPYFGKPVCEIIIAGDINGDCIVNYLDFRLMALNWLRDENQ